jgi:hypothetical protein
MLTEREAENVKRKVESREIAGLLMDLIAGEIEATDPEMQAMVTAEIVAGLSDGLPPIEAHPESVTERDPPMNYEEAKRFEKTEVPFHWLDGLQIGDAKIRALLWLDDQSDFRRTLNRYLRSDVGQARQDDTY